MRGSVSAFVALLIVHAAPLVAQSDAALQQIAEGWASGECNLLTHVEMNPETGNWQTREDSPWSTWTIRRAGPTSVEYTMSDGTIRRVEFADGVYRDRAAEDADEPPNESEEWAIVEHGIHGPENWRILLRPPLPPEAPSVPRYYSEVIMAGDVYVWTNWIEDEDGVRRRTMYSACKFAEG